MPKRNVAKKIITVFLSVLTAIVLFVTLAAGFFVVAEAATERFSRTLPSYARTDISLLAAKPAAERTEADYEELSRQTGLSRSAIDEQTASGLLAFQDALFYDGTPAHEMQSPITSRDILPGFLAPVVRLEAGDVLVTSANHAIGWRHGHAAIVVDDYGTTVEAVLVGQPSQRSANGAQWFRENANFMVLRLKETDRAARAEIGKWAGERLVGVPYSLTVGVLSKKDQGEQPKGTQCAHLVWQAFFRFGYDVDSDGGPVCTPRDLAGSDLFEVRQVFGFDPVKGW